MSLDFNLNEIKSGVQTWNESGNDLLPEVRDIVFATMSAGIGHITEKNYIEFFMRCAAASAVSAWPQSPDPITLEDVKKHIGLRTNVFPEEARTKWVKRIFENTEREYRYRAQRAEADAA